MNDRIELKGIRALGTIGVLPEEKIRSQPFEVDIWIETDLLKAGGSDDLSDTISTIIDDLKLNNQNLNNYPKNLPVGRPNELIPAKHLTVNWGDFELLEITE